MQRNPKHGRFVLGRFDWTDDALTMHMLSKRQKWNPGGFDAETINLTDAAKWTSRQAATKWLRTQDHVKDGEFSVINLDSLDAPT
jgi:hypothetical protein